MISITMSWAAIKALTDAGSALSYIHLHGNYYIYTTSSVVEYLCVVSDASSDATDFTTNYQSSATNLA